MSDNSMPADQIYTAMVGDKEVIMKTGKLAEQAGGAVLIQMGETVLFCSATMSAHPRDGIDFLPLSVDYEERLYAVGRIPGSFMRREGRPSERSILVARVTDRPLRPLFPKNLRNDIQVIIMSMAHDQINDVDMLSIVGASTALTLSDAPFKGPVGAARIGLIDGKLVVNPTIPEMEFSRLDLRVAGTEDAILMVECAALEVEEALMIEALDLAHESMQEVIQVQKQMAADVGREKRVDMLEEEDSDDEREAFRNKILSEVSGDIATIVATRTDRDDRNVAMEDLRERIVGDYTLEDDGEDEAPDFKVASEIRAAISDALKQEVRRRIVEDGVRPDGRGASDLRDLASEVGLLPRVHGSGLFKRGQTQVLSICTLGTGRDSQLLDGLHPEEEKSFLHHYNFPPYSTGETRMLRGPKRREIGHGALAENALRAVLPTQDEFPYTIRVVSEVMSSNGSTSMASVCAGCLALMDTGVPIKSPVAGIAMGLIKEGDKYVVLTDIQGMEDHLGDMDFKVAGTRKGINALQMDIKISGVPRHVLTEALNQAKDARFQILDVMHTAIAAPRQELNPYAPRMEIFKINPEHIGTVIGPGGKTVRGIQENTDTKIELLEDGTVKVASVDGAGAMRAKEMILSMVEEPENGDIYTGRITRIEDYGIYVEFLPGRDGMVHISQLSDEHIENIRDDFKVGDEVMVMITDVDKNTHKIRLSRQAVLEGWTLEEARANDKMLSGGGRRGGNRGGGNNRNNRKRNNNRR